MNERQVKKISEKAVKWVLSAILAIVIWGFLIWGYYGLPLDAGTYVGVIAWIAFTYFGWKFTFSTKFMKTFVKNAVAGDEYATSWSDRFRTGFISAMIAFVIKLILSVLVGVFVTPFVIAKMLAPKATAWLQRREELKGV